MEYRVRSSGEIKTKEELKKFHSNMSMPKIWNSNIHDALGVDPVNVVGKPEVSGQYKKIIRDGVEQDSKGNWCEKWTEVDMFSDTDEATKEEQEAEYQTQIDADEARKVRADRNQKLQDTDWMGMSDVAMSTGWATYRQALRDVPNQEGFPHEVEWPEEP
jgi:hypothetical protein